MKEGLGLGLPRRTFQMHQPVSIQASGGIGGCVSRRNKSRTTVPALLCPSHRGAQPGNPRAMCRASGWEWAGVTQSSLVGRARCWAGLLGRGQVREERKQVVGGSSPRLFWKVLGGGGTVSEEIQAPTLESRSQASLLSEGPISKVPPSQYQAGAAQNREP